MRFYYPYVGSWGWPLLLGAGLHLGEFRVRRSGPGTRGEAFQGGLAAASEDRASWKCCERTGALRAFRLLLIARSELLDCVFGSGGCVQGPVTSILGPPGSDSRNIPGCDRSLGMGAKSFLPSPSGFPRIPLYSSPRQKLQTFP